MQSLTLSLTSDDDENFPKISEILLCLKRLSLTWRLLRSEGLNGTDSYEPEGLILSPENPEMFDMIQENALETAFLVGYKGDFPGKNFRRLEEWCENYDAVISLVDCEIWSINLKDSDYYQTLFSRFSKSDPKFVNRSKDYIEPT